MKYTPDAYSKRFARFILFGNYFLAFCIVALSFETTLKIGVSLSSVSYYLIVFFLVVIYYTHAYITHSSAVKDNNARSQWYHRNKRLIGVTQVSYCITALCLLIFLLIKYYSSFRVLTFLDWLLLFVFPIIALLYYGIIFPGAYRITLRSIAWLKPFLIGFVCTGVIVVYPMLYYSLQQHNAFHLSAANGCYFLTNWLFTTAIAIMFDIKDFAADHNLHLKTFIVAKGLRYTLFFILLPLAAASAASFIAFAVIKQFSFWQTVINLIPFLLLLFASASLRRRRGILYYLIIIDGLLLVKAIFGILTLTVIP